VLLLASAALSFLFDGIAYKKQLNALNEEKRELLDQREESERLIIEAYRDTIRLKDLRIDSLDIEIARKKVHIIDIHNDIQLLKGDSLAIADALQRVFAR